MCAAKAVSFKEALDPSFKIPKQIIKNASALAQHLIDEGFDLVSGGTDNHLMLVDLRSKILPARMRKSFWIKSE